MGEGRVAVGDGYALRLKFIENIAMEAPEFDD